MNLNSHGLNLPDSSNMNSEGLGIKGPTFLIFFLMNDNSKKKKKNRCPLLFWPPEHQGFHILKYLYIVLFIKLATIY